MELSNLKKIVISWHLKAYRIFLNFVGSSKDKTSRNLFRLFQIAMYAVVVVFVTNLFSYFDTAGRGFGAFGDYFGGMLNPILTFLTFMGLLITIILQQKELGLTREELRNSSSALAEQAITQKKQRFENTFFALIDNQNKVFDTTNKPIEDANGRVYDYEFKEVLSDCRKNPQLIPVRKQLVSHYYQGAYQILQYIYDEYQTGCDGDELISSAVSVEENFYATTLRATMPHYVIQLMRLFYDESDKHDYKILFLVERYKFFTSPGGAV